MAQFATAAELAARLGVTFAGDEGSRATALLTLASGLIQQEARQTIELVTDDVLTIRGTRERKLLLPERPVVSVSSITLGGSAVSSDSYYIDGDHLVRGSGGDFLSDFSGGYGSAASPLVITYTHGYATIPDAIKAICIEAVVRVWVNPGSVAREAYGSESVVYPVQGMALTPDERRSLRRTLGRRSESATVR